MKKFIIYVLFVFICGFSAFFIYTNKQSAPYEGTAVPYIEQVLPLISTWDPELAKDYMAAEILARVSATELEDLMLSLSKVGQLESIDEIKFKNKSSGERISADNNPLVTYDLKARYSSGDAKVTIILLDKGESFEVYHFNFKTEALAQ